MTYQFLLLGIVLCFSACTNRQEHFISDKNFILITEAISNNKKYKIIEYQFDHGAFGYSRSFWAITPTENKNLNLADYLLPDGYKAVS